MNTMLILATCHILGFSPANGSAVYFGTDAEGAFAPAGFEERRIPETRTNEAQNAEAAAALAGVQTLEVFESVTSVPDGLFAGAPDLEAVRFAGSVTSLGARSFADCPKLNAVFFARRNPVDAREDTFTGSGSELTALYYGSTGRSGAKVLHPKSIWKHMTIVDFNGMCKVDPETKCVYREDRGPATVSIGRLLDTESEALVVPDRVAGMTVVGMHGDLLPSNTKAKYLYVKPKAELVLSDGGPRFKVVLTASNRNYHLRRAALEEGGRMYTYEKRQWSGDENVESVPSFVTLDMLIALTNGIPVENGYRYVVRDGSAAFIVGWEKERKDAREIAVPETLGGFPVVRLPPAFFAGMREMERLQLPSGLEDVPEGLCYGCPALKSVAIPATVKSIGRCAFLDCPALATPTLDPSVKIGEWAFDAPKITVDGHVTLEPM